MIKVLTRVISLAATALTATLAAPAPAQAVAYQRLKTIQNGTCLRTTSNPADLRAQSCSTKPVAARDWKVIVVGRYNGHPVWQIKNRKTGKCLSRAGTTGQGTLRSQTCTNSSNTWWEIFTVTRGKTRMLVFKNFGAFALGGRHACLRYQGAYRAKNVSLATCNVKERLQQWVPISPTS